MKTSLVNYRPIWVSICLEYVEDRAEQIYIYCSYENGFISSDFFYRINNMLVERHKLNDALKDSGVTDFSYDVSVPRQQAVLRIINENIEKIGQLCRDYKREVPAEMKLVYDVETNKLTANYKFEPQYTNDPCKTADDIAEKWFESIRLSL